MDKSPKSWLGESGKDRNYTKSFYFLKIFMENYFQDDKKIVCSCLWGVKLGSRVCKRPTFHCTAFVLFKFLPMYVTFIKENN